MITRKSLILTFVVFLVVLMMSGSTLARPLEAPLGTGFTYQGKLTDGGVPANGTYDFEFNLYDALTSGSQVGSTVTLGDVLITAGLFTVQLDFGDVFDGTALFLDIGVRAGASTGAYTALTPRQPLTATPYAIFASKAPWSGLTGVPAGFADGVDNDTTYSAGSGLALVGNEFSVTGVPWNGLSGVPAGFADGVDDNTTYTAGDGLELVGTQFKCKGTSYQNVVIVAKSGGDFTTITAALDSITTASDTNRYLIHIAPGVYFERVTMKEYVDIEGAGELTTKITYIGSSSITTGTVVGTNNAELRFLTVENTGTGGSIAIYNFSASPRLTHVTASASGGGGSYGVYNNNSSPTMTDVTASASGGTDKSYGVYNNNSSPTMTNVTASASGGLLIYGVWNYISSPTMTNVTASATGGMLENNGVYNDSSSPTMTNVTANAISSASEDIHNHGVYNWESSPTMTDVKTFASGGYLSYGVQNESSSSPTMTNVTASASGGTYNFGVMNESSSSPTMTDITASASGGTYSYAVVNGGSSPSMTNVTASASGGTNYNYGVANYSSSPTINNSIINASGGAINYGIYNSASEDAYAVLVNNSQISGSTNTILSDATFTTRVGATQLSGGAVSAGGGTVTCAGVYDEDYVFYASTCP